MFEPTMAAPNMRHQAGGRLAGPFPKEILQGETMGPSNSRGIRPGAPCTGGQAGSTRAGALKGQPAKRQVGCAIFLEKKLPKGRRGRPRDSCGGAGLMITSYQVVAAGWCRQASWRTNQQAGELTSSQSSIDAQRSGSRAEKGRQASWRASP